MFQGTVAIWIQEFLNDSLFTVAIPIYTTLFTTNGRQKKRKKRKAKQYVPYKKLDYDLTKHR